MARGGLKWNRLDHLKQFHDIVEVDPSIAVEIEY